MSLQLQLTMDPVAILRQLQGTDGRISRLNREGTAFYSQVGHWSSMQNPLLEQLRKVV